jgi:hypothetical protein
VTEPATVLISGTRAYRAGVTRGYARADMQFSQEGVAVIPTREFILHGLPFWAHEEGSDVDEYLSGYAVGFANRVQDRWPNGMEKVISRG